MVNRINEMVGAVGVTKTASDLHSLLQDPLTTGELIAGVQDFYIFSPDGQNLSCMPEPLAIAKSPWLAPLISNSPDGTENQIINTTDPAAIFFRPNRGTGSFLFAFTGTWFWLLWQDCRLDARNWLKWLSGHDPG